LLTRENIHVSASTIGRIIKKQGLINKKILKKRRKAALSPRTRFPKGLCISSEEDKEMCAPCFSVMQEKIKAWGYVWNNIEIKPLNT
jgi:hypothetical protein